MIYRHRRRITTHSLKQTPDERLERIEQRHAERMARIHARSLHLVELLQYVHDNRKQLFSRFVILIKEEIEREKFIIDLEQLTKTRDRIRAQSSFELKLNVEL